MEAIRVSLRILRRPIYPEDRPMLRSSPCTPSADSGKEDLHDDHGAEEGHHHHRRLGG